MISRIVNLFNSIILKHKISKTQNSRLTNLFNLSDYMLDKISNIYFIIFALSGFITGIMFHGLYGTFSLNNLYWYSSSMLNFIFFLIIGGLIQSKNYWSSDEQNYFDSIPISNELSKQANSFRLIPIFGYLFAFVASSIVTMFQLHNQYRYLLLVVLILYLAFSILIMMLVSSLIEEDSVEFKQSHAQKILSGKTIQINNIAKIFFILSIIFFISIFIPLYLNFNINLYSLMIYTPGGLFMLPFLTIQNFNYWTIPIVYLIGSVYILRKYNINNTKIESIQEYSNIDLQISRLLFNDDYSNPVNHFMTPKFHDKKQVLKFCLLHFVIIMLLINQFPTDYQIYNFNILFSIWMNLFCMLLYFLFQQWGRRLFKNNALLNYFNTIPINWIQIYLKVALILLVLYIIPFYTVYFSLYIFYQIKLNLFVFTKPILALILSIISIHYLRISNMMKKPNLTQTSIYISFLIMLSII